MTTRPRVCHQLGPSEEALMAHPSQYSGDAGGDGRMRSRGHGIPFGLRICGAHAALIKGSAGPAGFGAQALCPGCSSWRKGVGRKHSSFDDFPKKHFKFI